MLRDVLLISSSGLVLFSKPFAGALAQPRLVGSLIRTMVEFSTRIAGSPVSYIELTHVAVAVVGDPTGVVFCALVYDREDADGAGADFGHLMASHLLQCFVDEFGDELVGAAGHNLKAFQGFQYRLPRAVRDVARQVLGFMQAVPAVMVAALITHDFMIETLADSDTEEVDEVAVLAHVRPLLGAARDMLSALGDTPEFLTLEGVGSSTSRVLLWRLDSGTLVLRCRTSFSYTKAVEAVERPLALVRRLCSVLGHLQGGLAGAGAGAGPSGLLATDE